MRDRRKNQRVPAKLEIEMRRGLWEKFVTEDISRRGLFVRMASACALRQLIQIRVLLPGETVPLDMMARVTRRVPTWQALNEGRMPGVGLEFFCLDESVVAHWDQFIAEAGYVHESVPDMDAFSLGRELLRLRAARPSGRLAEAAQRTYPGGPGGASSLMPPHLAAPRPAVSSFIYRAQNLERLERFMREELGDGNFALTLPYEVTLGAAANLRVIHPLSLEEFILPGILAAGPAPGRYLLRFTQTLSDVNDDFHAFIRTGQGMDAMASS